MYVLRPLNVRGVVDHARYRPRPDTIFKKKDNTEILRHFYKNKLILNLEKTILDSVYLLIL